MRLLEVVPFFLICGSGSFKQPCKRIFKKEHRLQVGHVEEPFKASISSYLLIVIMAMDSSDTPTLPYRMNGKSVHRASP